MEVQSIQNMDTFWLWTDEFLEKVFNGSLSGVLVDNNQLVHLGRIDADTEAWDF